MVDFFVCEKIILNLIGKYKLVMFVMAKLTEMKAIEQNKIALYLFNIIEC